MKPRTSPTTHVCTSISNKGARMNGVEIAEPIVGVILAFAVLNVLESIFYPQNRPRRR